MIADLNLTNSLAHIDYSHENSPNLQIQNPLPRFLKEVNHTGESIAVTLRGETLAIVNPPGNAYPLARESVAATLQSLRPLLMAEDMDLEIPPRKAARRSALHPFPED
jgi:hypothetical protein